MSRPFNVSVPWVGADRHGRFVRSGTNFILLFEQHRRSQFYYDWRATLHFSAIAEFGHFGWQNDVAAVPISGRPSMDHEAN
jgi:hypothetical protein